MGNIMSSSFAPECTEMKQKYDKCFNEWYSEKFLKGKSNQNECQDVWDQYQTCVKAALHSQGIIKTLDEARKEAPFETGGVPKE